MRPTIGPNRRDVKWLSASGSRRAAGGFEAAAMQFDRGTSEILRREAESVGFVAEPFCLRWRKVDGEVHGDSLPWRRPVQRPV